MKVKYQNNTLYNFRTTKSLLWFVVAPIILAGFIILLLFTQIGVLVSNHKDIANAEEIIILSQQGKAYALQLQSSVRGYIIAGSEDYLVPYKNTMGLFDKNLDQLEKMLLVFQLQCTSCDLIQASKKEWIKIYDDVIKRRRKSVRAQPSGEELDFSAAKMAKVIQFFDDIVATQNLRLHEIRNNAENNIRFTATVIVIVSIFVSALFGYLSYLRMRKLEDDSILIIKDLEESRLDLEKANTDLENRVFKRTEELRAINSELETFCYSVSHDLRAPLRGIDGFSLALNEEYGQSIDETGKKYLNFIRIGVQKMGRIIDDLLKLSKVTRQMVTKSSFSFSDLANSVIEDTIKENPHRGYEIDRACFEVQDGIQVVGDERLLRVALENLISNAWKFSRKKEKPRILIGKVTKEDRVCYFVEDNGAGFDMNFVQKLFNPFQRLHSETEFEGTGIGLATVRRIILKHGGDIWPESKIAVGSTFYFTLSERNLDV